MATTDGTSEVRSRSVLAGLAPGPELARWLAELTVSQATDAELIEMLRAEERLKACSEGRQMKVIMELARRRPADPNGTAEAGKLIAVDEFAAEEVACALTWTHRYTQQRLNLCLGVCQRLPRVLDALTAGRIDLAKTTIIHNQTAHLDAEDAAQVADDVLTRAGTRTVSQLRDLTHRRAHKIKPRQTERAARKQAREARDVRMFLREDGNGELVAVLSAGDLAAAFALINSTAHQAKLPDDERGIGEIRAQALVDLILGPGSVPVGDTTPGSDTKPGGTEPITKTHNTKSNGHGSSQPQTTDIHDDEVPSGGKNENPETNSADMANQKESVESATTTITGAGGAGDVDNGNSPTPSSELRPNTIVNVTIPLSEFTKLWPPTDLEPQDEETTTPGEIMGLGYVSGWVIRDLVKDAAGRPGTAFRGVIYDDVTGTFIAATSLKYRLPAGLGDHIRLRDRTCRFPGCRQPAQRCDVDHIRSWHTGGSTSECNLHCLCRFHHRLKQNPAWKVHYQNGYTYWTAPTGHVYVTTPHDYRDAPNHYVDIPDQLSNGTLLDVSSGQPQSPSQRQTAGPLRHREETADG